MTDMLAEIISCELILCPVLNVFTRTHSHVGNYKSEDNINNHIATNLGYS